MSGNEREKPGDSQKPKTNHSRKFNLEYFVPFALSAPWSAAGAEELTGRRQSTPLRPRPCPLHLLFSADKNLEQRRSPKLDGYVNEKGQSKTLLIQKEKN